MILQFNGNSPITRDSAFIAPNASIIGKVQLGKSSSVWFGAVLRGDFDTISVGDNSNIQDNAVLHIDPGLPLSIGAGVTVGHSAVLHGCKIGNNCVIGMGAIILNGAEIGDNSIVGAGALVKERTKFPPGSLIVGHPAEFKKSLKDLHISKIKESAEHYLAKARAMHQALEGPDYNQPPPI